MKKRQQEKIGIIYIAIGIYDEFWNDFYPSCECYFCLDAKKGYEVFTDSSRLLTINLPHVSWHPVKDRGFIYNVSAKSEFICSIAATLKEKYDYIFFLNGNFKFVEPIYSEEVVPGEENGYLTALSFDFYKERVPDELPYDRNPECHAFIPQGQGSRYYQGGFYGGRTAELLQMSEWIMTNIQEDLKRKIIARWHDESYVNRYLKDRNPRILNETYAYVEGLTKPCHYKNIVLDKRHYLGEKLETFKDLSIDNSVSFLLDDALKIHKMGIVKLQGGLGNQMFQYTFMLYLRKRQGNQLKLYFYGSPDKQLLTCFPKTYRNLLPDELKRSISHINPNQAEKVTEENISCLQQIKETTKAVTLYAGYWQCAGYAEAVKDELLEIFQWQEKQLCEKYRQLKEEMRMSCSVSIHIRRGDYLSDRNKEVYGTVCTMDYYRSAIQRMKRQLAQKPTFFLFTDDPEWAKVHFRYKDCILVGKPEEADDWQDMCLMASCRHHIVANSSFSWWGAWLGENKNKQVIAPEWWYCGMPTPDLLPDTWIRIPLKKTPSLGNRLAAHLLFQQIMRHTDMPYWGEMTQIVYYYHLAGVTRKHYYRQVADEKLDDICNHLAAISSLEEFIKVCRTIVYLYHCRYISGKPNQLFELIDNFIQARIDTCTNNSLIDIAEYFIFRLQTKNMNRTVTHRLKKVVENILEQLWENKEYLSDHEKEKIFMILHQNDLGDIFKNREDFYLFCLKDLDINRLLKPCCV